MRVPLLYLPCFPVPYCLGKQGELSGNSLPNLTVRFILSPSIQRNFHPCLYRIVNRMQMIYFFWVNSLFICLGCWDKWTYSNCYLELFHKVHKQFRWIFYLRVLIPNDSIQLNHVFCQFDSCNSASTRYFPYEHNDWEHWSHKDRYKCRAHLTYSEGELVPHLFLWD